MIFCQILNQQETSNYFHFMAKQKEACYYIYKHIMHAYYIHLMVWGFFFILIKEKKIIISIYKQNVY